MTKHSDPLKRYEIDQDTGCWNWKGSVLLSGYGRLKKDSKSWLAHRYFFTEYVYDIPEHLELDHTCRNRLCVNVMHLELVTRKENNIRAGIVNLGVCRSGMHSITGDDDVVYKSDGTATCRLCRNLWAIRYRNTYKIKAELGSSS